MCGDLATSFVLALSSTLLISLGMILSLSLSWCLISCSSVFVLSQKWVMREVEEGWARIVAASFCYYCSMCYRAYLWAWPAASPWFCRTGTSPIKSRCVLGRVVVNGVSTETQHHWLMYFRDINVESDDKLMNSLFHSLHQPQCNQRDLLPWLMKKTLSYV